MSKEWKSNVPRDVAKRAEDEERVSRIVRMILDQGYWSSRAGLEANMAQDYYVIAIAERELRRAHEGLLSDVEKENEFLERQLKGTEEEVEAMRETVKHVTSELEDARAQRDIAGKSAKRLLAMLMSVHHRLPGDIISEMLAVRDAMKESEKK